MITSAGLTIIISALTGINFAMIAFKIERMKMMNSIKGNSSVVLGGAFAAFTPGYRVCTTALTVILGAIGDYHYFQCKN